MYAISWIDGSGNLWLSGGLGYDASGNGDYLNDLWVYSPATGLWTWVSGSSTVKASGNYGLVGTAASGHVPGARNGAVSWTDSAGDLWLFGGYGHASPGYSGYLNDLWKY
jgi:N-acetylneuraminic acid mutarotase